MRDLRLRSSKVTDPLRGTARMGTETSAYSATSKPLPLAFLGSRVEMGRNELEKTRKVKD